jgi:uncharacterized protein (TIRG00374 family)
MSISIRSYLAGLPFALATPARAGELARALYFRSEDVPVATGLVLVDKSFDLLAIMGLSLIGARIFLSQNTILLICLLTLIIVFILIFLKHYHYTLFGKIERYWIFKKLNEILLGLELLTLKVFLICFFLTVLMFFVIFLQCYTLLMTFYSYSFSFSVVLFCFPLVILSNIVPITIGGLGVRENVAVFCLSFFDIPSVVAFTATFSLFVLNVLLPSLIGIVVISQPKVISSRNP